MSEKDLNREAHFGMDLGTIVQVKFFESGDFFKGMIVGMERGFYLILRTPPLDNAQDKLLKEGDIIVRYSHRGATYGFVSNLLAYIEHPIQLSVFSYPTVIQSINLRSEDRVACFVPATALIEGIAFRGYISNISVNGCLFSMDLPADAEFPNLSPGHEASISTQLMGATGNQVLAVIIRSIRKEEREVNLGTEFHNLHTHFMEDIKAFIKNIIDFKPVKKTAA